MESLINKLNKIKDYAERRDKLKIEMYKKKKENEVEITKLLSDYYIEEFVFDIDFWKILFKKFYEEKGFNENYKEKCIQILEWGSFYNVNNHFFWFFFYESFLKLDLKCVKKEYFFLKKACDCLEFDLNLNIFLFKMLQLLFVNLQLSSKLEIFYMLKKFCDVLLEDELRDQIQFINYISIFVEGLSCDEVLLIFEETNLFKNQIDNKKNDTQIIKDEPTDSNIKNNLQEQKNIILNFLKDSLKNSNPKKIFRQKLINFFKKGNYRESEIKIFEKELIENDMKNFVKEFYLYLLVRIAEKNYFWKNFLNYLIYNKENKYVFFIVRKYLKIIGNVYPEIFQYLIIEQLNQNFQKELENLKSLLFDKIKEKSQINFISHYLLLFVIDQNNCETIFDIILNKNFFGFLNNEIFEILNLLLHLLLNKIDPDIFLKKIQLLLDIFEEGFLCEKNSILILNFILPILKNRQDENNRFLLKNLKKLKFVKNGTIDFLFGTEFEQIKDILEFHHINFYNNLPTC